MQSLNTRTPEKGKETLKPPNKMRSSKKVTEPQANGGLHLDEDWKCLFEEYKITELIGSGSFGSVYQATHLQSGRTVAIKRIADVFQH